MNRYQLGLVALLAVACAASCIAPPFPEEMFLQHSPTVVAIVALWVLSRRFPLSNASLTCVVAFLLLHVLGARYIYSYVPYDDWSYALFGVRISDRFHFARNHYDRVVHFFFGALWILPVWEVSTTYFRVPKRIAYCYAFEFVLAASMLYELFEWGLTVVLAPDDAEAYNGQQGDMWDAQKDMSLALLGGLIGLLVVLVLHRCRAGRSQT